MNEARLPYPTLAAPAFKGMLQMARYLEDCSLDKRFLELISLRVSQINGCTYCMDMHATALQKAGEDSRRLHTLAGWRESPLFSAPEKAALNWAELLTELGPLGAPDADYQRLQNHYSDQQIADLTFSITAINAWNRLGVGMRTPLPAEVENAA